MGFLEELKIKIATYTQTKLNIHNPPSKAYQLLHFIPSRIKQSEHILTLTTQKEFLDLQGIHTTILKITVGSSNSQNSFLRTHTFLRENLPTHPVLVNQDPLTVHLSDSTNGVEINQSSLTILANNKTILSLNIQITGNRSWLRIEISHTTPQHYFGGGENHFSLDKRGKTLVYYNTDYARYEPDTVPLYQSWPFVIFMDNTGFTHGLVFDHPGFSQIQFSKNGNQAIYYVKDSLANLYVLYGPSLREVLYQFSLLTGFLYPLPKWSLGYQQSRWSYSPQEEVLAIAKSFREKQIPCDVIYLDIDYMDNYKCFTFGRHFSPPKEFIEELHEQGFKVVPIIDPGIKKEPGYFVYDQGIKNHYFVKKKNGSLYEAIVWPGKSVFPDFFSNRVREWWQNLVQEFLKIEIDGIWCDMNEPSTFDVRRTMPPNLIHELNGCELLHEKIHNAYGYMMTRATYEGLKEHRATPFVLTRSSYLGGQKYSVSWTGDNKSSWEHFQVALLSLLNLGLSGQPFTGLDIGGFRENVEPVLFLRWLQEGIFYPFCRNHTAVGTRSQEPWAFGDEIEKASKVAISLRYKLIPYLYSLVYEAHVKGLPLLRPLFMTEVSEFTLNPQYHDTQALLGDFLLIAPYKTKHGERTLYMPKGTWYSWWSLKPFKGGQIHEIHEKQEPIPLFIKENTILPFIESPYQFIPEHSFNNLSLLISAKQPFNFQYLEYFTETSILGLLFSFNPTSHQLEIKPIKKGNPPSKYSLPSTLTLLIHNKYSEITFQQEQQVQVKSIKPYSLNKDWTRIALQNITYPITFQFIS